MVAAITIGTLFSPLTALQCATAILVSACPCTFGLITPLAVKIGIVKAAAEGIRFKSGQALQAAAQVDTVVFDLNGTLTTGKPEVSYASDSLNDYFGHIAAIEELSEHPFAKAILQHISKSPTNNPALKAASSDKKHHSGIAAVIDGESYILGNSSMMLSHGIDIAGYLNDEEGIYHKIYFAKDKQVLGYFLLKDPLRPDAKATVARLKQMGKKVHLCTGADKTIAQAYAKELNIDYVKANCSASSDQHSTPSGTKTAYIEAIAKGHKVAMVGDALNDTLAIEASAFGIAVESDATHEITQQKAGAVIHKINNEISLKAVITALTVAQHTVSNIKQNFLFSISYNMLALFVICSLVIGIGFVINPALGALLMAIQSSLVLANAYRFKNQPTHATNDCFYAENQLGQNSHALARTKLMPSPKVPTAIRETERPNKIRAQNLTPTPLTASPNHFFAASPNTTARGFDGAKHIKAMNPP
jgi:P-type Cu2+ transporter